MIKLVDAPFHRMGVIMWNWKPLTLYCENGIKATSRVADFTMRQGGKIFEIFCSLRLCSTLVQVHSVCNIFKSLIECENKFLLSFCHILSNFIHGTEF